MLYQYYFISRKFPSSIFNYVALCIWYYAPSFWMGGGLESCRVGRVCGADRTVRLTTPCAPHT